MDQYVNLLSSVFLEHVHITSVSFLFLLTFKYQLSGTGQVDVGSGGNLVDMDLVVGGEVEEGGRVVVRTQVKTVWFAGLWGHGFEDDGALSDAVEFGGGLDYGEASVFGSGGVYFGEDEEGLRAQLCQNLLYTLYLKPQRPLRYLIIIMLLKHPIRKHEHMFRETVYPHLKRQQTLIQQAG